MRRYAFLLLGLLVSALAGCATNSVNCAPPITASEKADPNTAYFFGTFTIVNSYFFSVGLGLEYVNTDDPGKTFVISFSDFDKKSNPMANETKGKEILTKGLVVVPVKPGRYVLTNIVYLSTRCTLSQREKMLDAEDTREFDVRPWQLYYVGDWTMGFAMVYYNEGGKRRIRSEHRILEIKDAFDENRNAVQTAYPALQYWPTVNAMRRTETPSIW